MNVYFQKRDIFKKKLALGEADNEQSKLVNELKNVDKGIKQVKKRYFLNSLGLIPGAREKILNNFKSRIFPVKNLDEIPTPEQAPEPATALKPAPASEPAPTSEPTKHKTSKLKLGKKFENEIKSDEIYK